MRNGGSKNNEQSKLMHVILTPVRVLGMVRELYMKGMVECAGKAGHGGVVGYNTVRLSGSRRLPNSFGRVSASSDEALIRELLRTVVYEGSKGDQIAAAEAKVSRPLPGGGGGKKYCEGLRRIGRIDENGPCSFEEDLNTKLCPRGNVVVVSAKNV